jgi:S-adenosylmethionine:tRNA ribosyltransferase-isomerase
LKTADFDYDLPARYIAQTPVEPRDASRLLVMNRSTGKVRHSVFSQLGTFLSAGDTLVINETRVFRARLHALKLPGMGRVELLLLKRVDALSWEALVGGSGLKAGRRLLIEGGPEAEIAATLGGPRRLVRFSTPIEPFLPAVGQIPLPPYIKTRLTDLDRYQTVYSRETGSAAAPTAGLHFTTELIEGLENRGIRFVKVILHVGLDTFAPVEEADPREHTIHSEYCQLGPEAARAINHARRAGGRVVAVGTTSVRTLESAARQTAPGMASPSSPASPATVRPFAGSTDLFILPGHEFRAVDALITNFHLPRSTLIMLVSAFAGRGKVLNAYEVAKREGYRFYSFGDAMLIL